MPISSCDENRLDLAQKAREMLDQGRKLVKAKKHAEALECYRFAFDNSLAVKGWGGVRLSYIPAEIADLGKVFPPAKAALVERRDAREDLVRSGEEDFENLSEWLALNQYLRSKDREMRLLKELQEGGKLSDYVKKRIIDSNFERLLATKQFDVLSEYLDGFGRDFLFKIFNYEEALLFPRQFKTKMPPNVIADLHKASIASDGAKVFELALGTGNESLANEISKRVLRYCDGFEAYAELITAAERTNQKRVVSELKKQAKAKLSKGNYALFLLRKFVNPVFACISGRD